MEKVQQWWGNNLLHTHTYEPCSQSYLSLFNWLPTGSMIYSTILWSQPPHGEIDLHDSSSPNHHSFARGLKSFAWDITSQVCLHEYIFWVIACKQNHWLDGIKTVWPNYSCWNYIILHSWVPWLWWPLIIFQGEVNKWVIMQTNDGILYLIYSWANSAGDKINQGYSIHCVDCKDMLHAHMGYKSQWCSLHFVKLEGHGSCFVASNNEVPHCVKHLPGTH